MQILHFHTINPLEKVHEPNYSLQSETHRLFSPSCTLLQKTVNSTHESGKKPSQFVHTDSRFGADNEPPLQSWIHDRSLP